MRTTYQDTNPIISGVVISNIRKKLKLTLKVLLYTYLITCSVSAPSGQNLQHNTELIEFSINQSIADITPVKNDTFDKQYKFSDKDIETLAIILFTESGRSTKYEWQLILECVLYRYYRWGGTKRGKITEYINKNKMVFQGYLDKYKWYEALKMKNSKRKWRRNRYMKTQETKKLIINCINFTNKYSTHIPRQIRNYHNTNVPDTIIVGGVRRTLNKKHIRAVEAKSKRGELIHITHPTINLIHDFYEVPKINKDYVKWRNSLSYVSKIHESN